MSVNNNKRITKAARYNAKKINYDRIATSYRNIHICGILSIDKHMTNYTMSYRRHLLLSKGNYVNVCLPLIGQHSKTPFTNEKPFETPPTFWHAPTFRHAHCSRLQLPLSLMQRDFKHQPAVTYFHHQLFIYCRN